MKYVADEEMYDKPTAKGSKATSKRIRAPFLTIRPSEELNAHTDIEPRTEGFQPPKPEICNLECKGNPPKGSRDHG